MTKFPCYERQRAMAPSPAKSEHWLTLMCCAHCRKTPDESPVYLCNLGHTICLSCFKGMTKTGVPLCFVCKSQKFTAKVVSPDFLKKLKTCPGIGRPCRYNNLESPPQLHPKTSTATIRNRDDSVTLEKIFKMSSEDLRKLFEATPKRRTKLTNLNSTTSQAHFAPQTSGFRNTNRPVSGNALHRWSNPPTLIPIVNSSPGPSSQASSQSLSLQSRKPLTCPHDPCNKIIAMSSFQLHFKHEHADIEKVRIGRGDVLQLHLTPAQFEFDRTVCLAMVTVTDRTDFNASTHPQGRYANIARMFPQTFLLGTYWLMMSGSQETKKTHAYVLFWLFTNETKEHPTNINCTMELSTLEEDMSFSTFCAVNVIPEDLSIPALAKKLDCLQVTYGGIESMFAYGNRVVLNVTIH